MVGLSLLLAIVFMRPSNSLPLDDDIVDLIFTLCPDFESLDALALSCKSLRAIFCARPNSITTAVAWNSTGLALPEALCLIRCPVYNGNEEQRQASLVLTAAEQILLRENAIVVNKLERLFSRWHKNPRKNASVLTADEAFRFRRAMSRVTIFCARFNACTYDEEECVRIGRDSVAVASIRAKRLLMLNSFPTTDLREIDTVVRFLTQVLDWVIQDDSSYRYDSVISVGPGLILAALETRDITVLDDSFLNVHYDRIAMFCGFLTKPLAAIWRTRDVATPSLDCKHVSSILDAVRNRDACSRCPASSVPRLWTSATWQYFSVQNPFRFLPGQLHHNRNVMDALDKLLLEHGPSILIREILCDVVLRPGFMQWTEDDVLCCDCLEQLLKTHVYLWLRRRRVKDGWIAPEDCRRGYRCTHQDNVRHAETRNHLCEPEK
ncbi:hypothetical protein C8R47DRAFT_1217592 [Mycena vitilis]|nr:hypothetical protein C8R47DRAFT_1217586 [Mycena vitilis]KAJ6483507.1 hypothetical protein C8R47DRAFT_1217588 [Mycena vitilis]KAJ6483509.1 hypothetical protein C8R47DRAFT_1217590 [Mycena vitilis]KAJ6483511.1 hypothetical protein C8R47DRAFT_1217592 [Mycena vitilis]